MIILSICTLDLLEVGWSVKTNTVTELLINFVLVSYHVCNDERWVEIDFVLVPVDFNIVSEIGNFKFHKWLEFVYVFMFVCACELCLLSEPKYCD